MPTASCLKSCMSSTQRRPNALISIVDSTESTWRGGYCHPRAARPSALLERASLPETHLRFADSEVMSEALWKLSTGPTPELMSRMFAAFDISFECSSSMCQALASFNSSGVTCCTTISCMVTSFPSSQPQVVSKGNKQSSSGKKERRKERKQRETERQRDRETERQRGRETERQRDRERERERQQQRPASYGIPASGAAERSVSVKFPSRAGE